MKNCGKVMFDFVVVRGRGAYCNIGSYGGKAWKGVPLIPSRSLYSVDY